MKRRRLHDKNSDEDPTTFITTHHHDSFCFPSNHLDDASHLSYSFRAAGWPAKHSPQDNLSFIDCLLKFSKIQIEDIFIVKGRGSKKADTDIEPT